MVRFLNSIRMKTRLRTGPSTPQPRGAITRNELVEASPENTVIGTLSVQFPKPGAYVWTITDTVGGKFKLVGGNQLVAGNSPTNFSLATSHFPVLSANNGVDPAVPFSPEILILDVPNPTTLTAESFGRNTRVGVRAYQLAAGATLDGATVGTLTDWTLDATGGLKVSASGASSLDPSYTLTIGNDPACTQLIINTLVNTLTMDNSQTFFGVWEYCRLNGPSIDWTVILPTGTNHPGGGIGSGGSLNGSISDANEGVTAQDMIANPAVYDPDAEAVMSGGSVTFKALTPLAAKVGFFFTYFGPVAFENLDFTRPTPADHHFMRGGPYVAGQSPPGTFHTGIGGQSVDIESQIFMRPGVGGDLLCRGCRFGIHNSLPNTPRRTPAAIYNGQNNRVYVEDCDFNGVHRALWFNSSKVTVFRRNHVRRIYDDCVADYNQAPLQSITATGTSQRIPIPTWLKAEYITVSNQNTAGVDAYVKLGNSSVVATPSDTLVPTFLSAKLTIGANTHLAYISESASTALLGLGPHMAQLSDNTVHDVGTLDFNDSHTDFYQVGTTTDSDYSIVHMRNNVLMGCDGEVSSSSSTLIQANQFTCDTYMSQNVMQCTTAITSIATKVRDALIENNTLFTSRPRLPGDEQRQSRTCTMATDNLVTLNAHGFVAGDHAHFTTTGALLSPLVPGHWNYYWVISPTANTFKLALTPGGVEIDLSGTQSGTHTCHGPISMGVSNHLNTPGRINIGIANAPVANSIVVRNNIVGELWDLSNTGVVVAGQPVGVTIKHFSDPGVNAPFRRTGNGVFTATGNLYRREQTANTGAGTSFPEIFSGGTGTWQEIVATAAQLAFQPSVAGGSEERWFAQVGMPSIDADKATWDQWVEDKCTGVGTAVGKGRTEF